LSKLERYGRLRRMLERELENPEIQAAPPDLYKELSEYMRDLRSEVRMASPESLRGSLLRREVEVVERMVRRLLELRVRKIVSMVAEGVKPPAERLTPEERRVMDSLSEAMEEFRGMVEAVLMGRAPRAPAEKPSGMKMVRILKPLPQIVGSDMKVYGPFKPEDIVLLPERDAENLIRGGAAVEVEVGDEGSERD